MGLGAGDSRLLPLVVILGCVTEERGWRGWALGHRVVICAWAFLFPLHSPRNCHGCSSTHCFACGSMYQVLLCLACEFSS